MKKILSKILIVLLIILILNNFFMTPVHANVVSDIVEGILESVIGLFTIPVRAIAVLTATGMNMLTAKVAYIDGATDPDVKTSVLTPFDIFFNKVKVVDINFFDVKTSGTEADSLVNKIRGGIAGWYYIMRILATAILLLVLIYIGIKMAISTIASDKALYKKMLVDWVASLALVFLMQYIMIFTITVNNSIVNAISLGVDSEKISSVYDGIRNLALKLWDPDAIAATIIFCMLVWQTIGLLISYFNRMLKLAFLVIISPLVTLTYAVDKIGDGKAQALGAWLKEFVFTILIQPFHCIIYMCFMDIAFNLLATDEVFASTSTLATSVVAILCVRFVKDAEKIVRKIFAFKDDNSSTSIGAGMAVSAFALSKAKSFGKSTRASFNSAKNFGRGAKATLRNAKVNALAAGAMIAHIGDKAEDKQSFSDRKAEVRTNMNEKKAEKIEKKYKATPNDEDKAKINATAEKILKDNPGITEKEAKSIARVNYAKKKRSENGAIRKRVGAVSKAVGSVRKGIGQVETFRNLGNLGKTYIASGLGLMVGSGVYGTNGNLVTALTSGAAVYKGTNEFMKSSTGTLVHDVKDNFEALGIKGQMGVDREIGKVLSKFADPTQAKKEQDKIMDEIASALKSVQVGDKYKTQIKNTIERGIKADPSKTQDVIKYALSSLKDENGNQLMGSDGKDLYTTNGGRLRNATQKLADYTNESQIYQSFQTAGALGLSADAFAGSIIKSFDDTGDFTEEMSNEEIISMSIENVDDAEEFKIKNDIIDDNTSQMNMEQIEILEEEYNKNIKELEDVLKDEELNFMNENEKNSILEQIKILEQQKNDVIGKALSQIDRDFTDYERKIAQEYKKQLEAEQGKIKSELEAKVKEINTIKSKIQISQNEAEKKELTNKLNTMNAEKELLDKDNSRKIETVKNLTQKITP